jgi:hypothetical protein
LLALKGRKFEDILEVFKQVQINIPFLDDIQQVPSYAKFLKDLITVKRKTNVLKKVCLTEQVNSILQCKLPIKYKDPRCPTISCTIGVSCIEKALLDLGASVNLLSYSVYLQLGLGELKPTSTTLQLTDRSVKIPRGIVEDVLIKVEEILEEAIEESSTKDPLKACFAQFGEDLDLDMLLEHANAIVEFAPLESIEKEKAAVPEPPKNELKPLPDNLMYKFLGPVETLPVIIVSDLHAAQEEKLLDVMREHKEAIGWTFEDIKGISPSVVMHKIHLEEDAKPSREPQRRLNPSMQEVVRGEVIKLLDAGIIYPISDSKWVSPIHDVPKQAGVAVVQNKDCELVPT